MMRFKKLVTLVTIQMLINAAFFSVGHAAAADMAPVLVTMSGTVTDSFELETDDGLLLAIEPDKQGLELIFNHVWSHVEVIGTMVETKDDQGIRINSYRIIAE
jgi:hypothetical protein